MTATPRALRHLVDGDCVDGECVDAESEATPDSLSPVTAVTPEIVAAPPYGLASSLRTKDPSRGMRVPQSLALASVRIKTPVSLVADMPHCGTRPSGYGKSPSLDGFQDHTRITHIMATTDR